MNICQTVKKNFRNELELVRERTNGNSHEHGFAVCLNGGSQEAGKIVEGSSQSVLVPGCTDETVAVIHTHRHSPAMEARLGRGLIRKYTGYPSAVDLQPHPTLRNGCVLTDNSLVCFEKATASKPEIERLKMREHESNVAFILWSHGDMTDDRFRKTVGSTVRAQKAAMGSYCTATL